MSKNRKNKINRERFNRDVPDRYNLKPIDILKAIERQDIVELEELFAYAETNDLIEELIKNLMQPFQHGDSLYELLDTQNLQVIDIVLDRLGYNIITDNDDTALIYSVFEGRLDCVKFLVENGANINLVTPEENFALYASVLNLDTDRRNIKVFEYLYPLTSPHLQQEIQKYCPDNLCEEIEKVS